MKTRAIKNASEISNENTAKTNATFLQPKLSVGEPDDKYEKEADAVADKVMRMPEQNFIQRKCAHCEEEEKKQVQRKPISQNITTNIQAKGEAGISVSNSVSNKINSSQGSGSSMDRNTQSFMSSRFGNDFSNVKIHTDGEAIQMNRELNAKAFTVGNDVYFNEGEYQPDSDSGKHLLAHELTHTIQQNNQERIMRSTITDDFIKFETAAPHDPLGGKPDFSAGDYSVNDLLLKIDSYKKIKKDIKEAFKAVYGKYVKSITVNVKQTDNTAEIACGKNESSGCCPDCDENCNKSLGLTVVNEFNIRSLLHTSKDMSVFPKGFKVKDLENTLVATASTMFHELLHLWFYQYRCVYLKKGTSLPSSRASGHDDASKNEYEKDFVTMWQMAVKELESKYKEKPYKPKPTAVKDTRTKNLKDLDIE